MTARNEDRLIEIRAMLAQGISLSEIARRLGVTRQRASQLIHKAGYKFVTRLEHLTEKSHRKRHPSDK